MQVSFASNNPHCSSAAQAWLTPWLTGMVGVESDPNWGNVKSPRITSVARLSQRIQGDTESPLLGVHSANESACAVHRVLRQLECICPSILKTEGFFSPSDERLTQFSNILRLWYISFDKCAIHPNNTQYLSICLPANQQQQPRMTPWD